MPKVRKPSLPSLHPFLSEYVSSNSGNSVIHRAPCLGECGAQSWSGQGKLRIPESKRTAEVQLTSESEKGVWEPKAEFRPRE